MIYNELCLTYFKVRRVNSHVYPQNTITLNHAWLQAENGQYTLEEFQRYTAHTPEQILMVEIGEPVFVESEFYYYFILYT